MWKGSVLAVLAALLVCSDASRLRIRRGIQHVDQKDAPVANIKSSSGSGSLSGSTSSSGSGSLAGDASLQQAGSGAGGSSSGAGGSISSGGAAGSSSGAGGSSSSDGATKGAGGATKCADSPVGWVSNGNEGCEKYEKKKWCTPEGKTGPGWKDEYVSFAKWAVDGIDASQACCACGGGTSGGGSAAGGGGAAGDGLVDCPDHMKWCTEEGFVCRMADNAEADLEEVKKEVRFIMSPTHARQRPASATHTSLRQARP